MEMKQQVATNITITANSVINFDIDGLYIRVVYTKPFKSERRSWGVQTVQQKKSPFYIMKVYTHLTHVKC